MKPIIIYLKTLDDNKFVISRDEFEKLIEQVCEQGKLDGMNHYFNPVTYPTYPVVTYSTKLDVT